MAISQIWRSGVARTLEIGAAAASLVNIGGYTGRDAVGYTYDISRPSNPTSTNSTARGTEQIGTLEVSFTANGSRTDNTAPVIDQLMEPTRQVLRFSDRNKASNVPYDEIEGIPMVTISWEAAGIQTWSLDMAVDAEPTAGTYT